MVIPAGGGAQRDSSSTPMDLLWTPAHAPAKQQTGGVSCPHLLPGQEEKTLPGEGTVGGAYQLLPSYHVPLPSPFQYRKRNSGSKVTHPSMPAHAPHTHSRLSPGDGTEQEVKWARAEVRYGGLLLPPTARTQDAQTHAHTCTRGWGWLGSLGDEETV